MSAAPEPRQRGGTAKVAITRGLPRCSARQGALRMRVRNGSFAVLAVLAFALLAACVGGRPTAAQTGSTVILTLRNMSREAAPVPRVPGVTRVSVPLYPGATPTSKRFPMTYEDPVPGSPYLRAAGEKFQVGATESDVEAWYRRWMAKVGWSAQGSGSSGNLRTGVSQDMLAFAPPGSARDPDQLSVYIWFYAVGAKSTLIGVWATKVVQPPRPSSSFLARTISVTGNVVTYGTSVATRRVDITNQTAISRLVAAINRLKRLDAGMHGCPAIMETADLAFHAASGPAIVVRIEVGCAVSVGQVGLEDYPSVRGALRYAMAHASR